MKKKEYQDYPEFMTTKEVAELLNLPLSTVLKKIREDIIPVHHYSGRSYIVRKDDLYAKPKKIKKKKKKKNKKN